MSVTYTWTRSALNSICSFIDLLDPRRRRAMQYLLVFPISESKYGIGILLGNTCASGIAGKRVTVTGA